MHCGFEFSCVTFRNRVVFTVRSCWPLSQPPPRQEDRPLSALCDCFFTVITIILHIWRPPSPHAVVT